MPRHRKKPRALLDYDTIAAASTGDPDAMAEVLRHFDGFISKLATRTFRDANNVSFSGVDQEMKERMQLKLIASLRTSIQSPSNQPCRIWVWAFFPLSAPIHPHLCRYFVYIRIACL